MRNVSLVILSVLVFANGALCAPNGASKLPSSKRFNRADFTCGKISGKWTSGRMIPGGYFYPHNEERKNILDSAKKAKGAKKAGLLSQAAALLSKINERNPLCLEGPNFGTPTPTPTASPTPTPSPQPLVWQAAQVAIGDFTACAVTTQGELKCWGNNALGSIGNGIAENQVYPPTTVSDLGTTAVTVGIGMAHTCALTTGGGVKCWGSNAGGAIGSNPPSTYVPSDVTGLSSGVAELMVEGFESCVLLTADNSIKCWGGSIFNPLPDPTSKPNFPGNLLSFSQGSIYLGTVSDGGAKCWAASDVFFNRCANGALTKGDQYVVDVYGLTSGVNKLASSGSIKSSCAITAGGGVKCWGRYWTNNGLPYTPVSISGISSGATDISVGGSNNTPKACAVVTGGAVKCWGDGANGDVTLTTPISSGAVSVIVGPVSSCAIVTSGQIKCWGTNTNGILGDGTTTSSEVPVNVWQY